MEQMAKTLELLAAKLGTTTEYLWGVMLKQAPISAIMDFAQYLLLILACVFWFVAVKIIKVKVKSGWDERLYLWVIVTAALLVLLLIVAFFRFPTTFYALIHPEYWALDQILDRLAPATK